MRTAEAARGFIHILPRPPPISSESNHKLLSSVKSGSPMQRALGEPPFEHLLQIKRLHTRVAWRTNRSYIEQKARQAHAVPSTGAAYLQQGKR